MRVDASTQIGSGHVMRCLTLAEELRRVGWEIGFVCRPMEGDLIALVRRHGFDVVEGEPKSIRPSDWLVVDHYGLGPEYESAMRRFARRVMVIDDLGNRAHDCDLLLDQNLNADMESRYVACIPSAARALLGPKFALLRPEFTDARQRVNRTAHARRIFVFFGGGDTTNETLKALRALQRLAWPGGLALDILLGSSNPHRAAVEQLAAQIPQARVIIGTARISEWMLKADLALGAGGATTWERCCLGLPTIAIAVAENQESQSQAVAAAGLQKYLGTADRVSEELLARELRRSLDQFPDTLAMGLRGMQLVDGLGTQRVAAAMQSA